MRGAARGSASRPGRLRGGPSMQPLAPYEQRAALFEYPQPDYPARVRTACQVLEGRYPLAAARLAAFGNALPAEGGTFSAAGLGQVQAISARPFDVQPLKTPPLG